MRKKLLRTEHPGLAKYVTLSLADTMIQKFVWHVKRRSMPRTRKMF